LCGSFWTTASIINVVIKDAQLKQYTIYHFGDTVMMSNSERELNVGNKSPNVYLGSALALLHSQGKCKIAGLGAAMLTAARLAGTLTNNGFIMDIIELEFKELPGRMLDKSDPEAVKNRKFIPTGKTAQVPRLVITMRK